MEVFSADLPRVAAAPSRGPRDQHKRLKNHGDHTLPITLEANGKVIHATETEEEMWGWVAANLPDDVVFYPTEEEKYD